MESRAIFQAKKVSIELGPRDTNIGQDHDGDGNEDNQCSYWCHDCSPDYDYTALVSKVGGEADVTIEDPEGEWDTAAPLYYRAWH